MTEINELLKRSEGENKKLRLEEERRMTVIRQEEKRKEIKKTLRQLFLKRQLLGKVSREDVIKKFENIDVYRVKAFQIEGSDPLVLFIQEEYFGNIDYPRSLIVEKNKEFCGSDIIEDYFFATNFRLNGSSINSNVIPPVVNGEFTDFPDEHDTNKTLKVYSPVFFQGGKVDFFIKEILENDIKIVTSEDLREFDVETQDLN